MLSSPLSLSRWLSILALALAFALSACGSQPEDDDDSAGDDDDSAGDDDDSAGDDDDDSGSDDDDAVGDGALLQGEVLRSAEPVDGQDAIGDLFLTVLGNLPSEAGPPEIIATSMIPGADFSNAETPVAYQIADIPVRAEEYYITAFLDDDLSGPQDGPNKNDMFSPPIPLVIDTVEVYSLNIDLSESGAPGPPPGD
ncbi:MAG: hypothetical protein VX498_05665 [Myxococcota bacterium]|nr:hypothetical protein [Myxococcota bacterium]